MIEIAFSEKEQEVLTHLSRIAKRKGSFTVLEICSAYYRRRAKPKNYRSSMSALLRSLILKTNVVGDVAIDKISAFGRGHVGEYSYKVK